MFHKIKVDNGKSERKVYTIGSFKLWGHEFLIHVDTDSREIIYCASEKNSGYLALTSAEHDPELFRIKLKKDLTHLFGTNAKDRLKSTIERSIKIHGGVSDA